MQPSPNITSLESFFRLVTVMGFKAALAAFPAKRLIENNYYRTDFNMQVLADKLHLNRAYLRNIFSEYEHVSPKLYLVTARMTHARAFLEDADMPIHFVANSVGYEDPLQFTKTTNPYNPTQSSAAPSGIFSAVSDAQKLAIGNLLHVRARFFRQPFWTISADKTEGNPFFAK